MKRFYNEKPIIVPKRIKFYDEYNDIILPSIAIGTFSRKLIEYVINNYETKKVGYVHYSVYDLNVYIVKYNNNEYTFYESAIGGACVSAEIEELHASGVNKFIIFGTAGILNQQLDDINIIIPQKAYRDEGTSYSYVKSKKDYLEFDNKYTDDFIKILSKYNFNYIKGNTWTTDCFYRETVSKMNYFIKKGCICVEMEGSALAAVSKYLNIDLFTFYYSADTLYNDNYDSKGLACTDNYESKIKIIDLVFDFVDTYVNNK